MRSLVESLSVALNESADLYSQIVDWIGTDDTEDVTNFIIDNLTMIFDDNAEQDSADILAVCKALGIKVKNAKDGDKIADFFNSKILDKLDYDNEAKDQKLLKKYIAKIEADPVATEALIRLCDREL